LRKEFFAEKETIKTRRRNFWKKIIRESDIKNISIRKRKRKDFFKQHDKDIFFDKKDC